MTKIYNGNTPELYKLFVEGKQLQFRHHKNSNWVDIPKYNGESNDIYRVGNNFYQFREKPQDVITKVYMHYDDMEERVQSGIFNESMPTNLMFKNNKSMDEHLEFTFTNGKLTKVEMKNATN